MRSATAHLRSALRRLRSARVAALLAAAVALPAYAGCQVDSLELPITMIGSRAVATLGINGTSLPMMVDSGAFFSFLTDATAAQLKLPLKSSNLRIYGVTGRVDAQTTTVDKLQLLKGDIDRVQFVVGGNDPGAGAMGIVGRNILSFTDTEYDLAHGVIRFLFPNDDCKNANMAYWAGSTPVTELDLMTEDRSKTPAIRGTVRLNGTKLTALFDTGATTVVSARAARRAGVAEADMKLAGTMYGAGSGTAKMWTAAFDRFEIGGEVIHNNHLRVGDFDLDNADLLLGIDFFLSHRIYISKKQEKMYVTYNGGPVFSLDRSDTASAAPTDANPAPGAAQGATADELARRGAASAARRDYASALADLDRAIALQPASAALLAQRGVIQMALKHPAKAMEDFDGALKLDPAQVDAHFQRAVLRLAAKDKDRDGAKADLDALDRRLPPQAQLRLAIASLYLTLEQPAAAITQLDQWLAAHPNDIARGGAFNTRCWARVMLGSELDKALTDCNEAVDSDEKNAAYLDSRGWVYFRAGKDRKALEDFDRSIELRSVDAWTLYGRGLTKTRLGDATQGAADLAAARKAQADIDAKVARIGVATEGLANR